jgi:Secretion system C-terminal sorting domain/PKD-like domain
MKKLFTLLKIILCFLLFGIQFSKAQTLQVSSPNGGESWLGGSSHAITWTYANVDNIKIEYSLNNGLTWTIITSSYPASALSYNWTVPCIGSSLVKVRITNILQFTQDESNTTFTIPEPTVDITYPNGGESFGNGTGQYITWNTTGVTTLALQYTTDNGLTWTNIGNFPAVNTYCNWITPATATNQVRIRGYNIESTIDRDSSTSLFSVTTLPAINNDKYKGGSYDGYKMCSSLSDTIKVLTPNGGEVLNPTSNVNITWSFRNIDNVKIEYTTDNGLTWNLIATNIPVDVQKYTWTVPNIPSTQCLIKITALDRPLYDISDAVFTINSAFVHLTYPNGGESFGTSTGQYIEWEYNSVTTVNLEYSTNNGVTWTSIGTAPAANKYANWIPPTTISNQYLLRVSDNSVPSLLDISDANFSVVSVPTINLDKYKGGSYDGYSMANSYADSIKVTSPNGGELWTSASNRTITWTYNNVDNISIEYSLNDGITWTMLAANLPASQLSYSWTIPTTPSNLCRIRIKDLSRNLQDISDAAFIIPTAYVQITYPNGGERFGGGTGQYIEWNYADLQTIQLEYSTDNGVNWLTIGTAPAANKYANWVVPTNVSSQILIRATDVVNPIYTDKSNTAFSSFAIPTINLDKYKGGSFDGYSMYSFFDSYVQIKKPNGGEIWGNGTTQQIKWAKLNNNENIILDYTTDNEATWTTLLNNVPDTPNVYNWTINAPVSNICKVRARTVTGTLLDKSDDFFTIANPNGIVTNAISGTIFCSGANATVNFSLNTTFISGNRFIVQLSDSVGTFNGSVINIGEVSATTPQAIPVTFPARYYSSNLYRLRVIGTNPPTIGTDNGTNFTINPLPYVNLGNDTILCTGTSITLNATNSSSTYLWSTGATTPTISVSSAGRHSVAVTNSCGTSRDTIIVTGVTQPSVNLGVDTSICINSSLTLNAGTNASVYLWSTGATSQTISVVTPGTYSVAVSNVCGTKRDTIVITNKSTFTVDLGADRAICSGQTITLNAGNAGLSYLWSTGQTTQIISVTQPGIYWVNVSDVCQTISDQINIINGALNVNIGGTLSVCNGTATTLTATGGNSYVWNTGSSSSSITVAPIVNTTYSVTSTNYYGCTSAAQSTVTVNNLPTAQISVLSGSTTFCAGDSVVLSANSGVGYTYQWYKDGVMILNATGITYTVNSSGSYTVKVSNASGCSFVSNAIVTAVNALPIATITASGATTFCSNGNVVLSANVASVLSYQWQLNGNNIAGAIAANYQAMATGNYRVRITSTTNNCIAYSNVIAVSVIATTSSTQIVSACSSYVWNGVTYTSSGLYQKTFVNAVGCDSIATLNLTVKQTSFSTTNATSCGSYVWNGVTYTSSGTYSKVTTNAVGCDSTAILNLTLTTANNTAPSGITGARNISKCDTLQNYSVLPITGVTFTWTVTGVGNSVKTGQGTNAVVLVMKVAGTISVKATNACGIVSTATTLDVTKATPTTPGAISQSFIPTTVAANTNACLFTQSAFATTGVADTFRIRAVANSTGYTWKTPTGSTVTRVNDTTIAVVFANTIVVPDSIKVYSLSFCDTSLSSRILLTKTVAAAAANILKSDGVTVATTDVCPNVGGSVTYKVRKVATAISYNWYMTRGTKATITHINPLGLNDTAVIVNYQTGFTADSINVSCSNGCGNSAVKLLKVSAILLPPTPSTITASSGNFYPCPTNTVQYTVASPAATTAQSPKAVYRWTRPANTTITASNADSSVITIRFESTYTGGSLSVKCQTACGIQGTAKAQTLYYTPPTPTGINSGSGYNVCIGSTVSLTCSDPVSGGNGEGSTQTQTPITMHRWTRPNFTSITSATADSGTISLLIQTGFTGGNVSAKCQSSCGVNGTAKSQALTHTACPSGTKNSNANTGAIGSFDVNIFPNPTKSSFNLQVSSTSRETFSVKVLDVQGRLIKSKIVFASEINNIGNDLKSGVYMFEITQGKEKKTVRGVKY